ncbi:Antigenic cell wall galactomannoprotein [Madurella fahalii]|uniref:Antigenic cell wall galactomannoprotein n=1 Tax=Madurella fahalii TaxID=1157608 RepID=A0ABQ0GNM8_9PEZI
MKLTAVLTPLAFASAALADGAAIIGALAEVNDATVQLGEKVGSWTGDILGTLPIVAESTSLLIKVKKGTKTAEESEALDFLQAIDVATATYGLVGSVNATMTNLINAKPKFDKLLMSPIIFINLGLQRKATTEMSEAIISKVPVELQAIAQDLVAPIDASFELAIDAFHPLD